MKTVLENMICISLLIIVILGLSIYLIIDYKTTQSSYYYNQSYSSYYYNQSYSSYYYNQSYSYFYPNEQNVNATSFAFENVPIKTICDGLQ